jgi:non-specific protein-tyrosine kinase
MSKLKKALEKAKETRATGQEFPFEVEGEARKPLAPVPSSKEADRSREVKVTYSRTKIVPVDPHVLRKNKIFSLFQDNDVADQIKILRTQVLKGLEKIGGNSVLVTSANQGEGKTFTSINLGVSIAQELNRTVLLVDADLRNPAARHYDFAKDFFSVKPTKGLADYLIGDAELAEILLNPGIEKLTILPAGKALPNSSELLGSDRMKGLLTDLKSRYSDDRIVIVDSSALLVSADALLLSQYTAGVLLVVEMEKTTPKDIKKVMELLKDAKILGTVMNKAK